MLAKPLLHSVLSKIRHGGLEVTYWDGEARRYGPETPWVAVTFHDAGVVRDMRKSLDLAIGEAYMDGRLDIDGDPAQLGHLGDANRRELAKFLPAGGMGLPKLSVRRKTAKESRDVRHHYDIGNDFYKLWLDKSLTYSCAYFKKPEDSLEVAQRQKVEYILRKLNLKRGMTLLDIGSGWGELIIRAAKRHGVRSHGITVSHEQYQKTRERIEQEGLSGRVSVEFKHYDELRSGEPYDRVVSVGMYEHVGRSNHPKYMAAVDRHLKPGGLSLLHTITQVIEYPLSPWINKYIFPGGYLPTLENIIALLPKHDFHTIDVESLRRHYARTLDIWHDRFTAHEPEVERMYDAKFVKMWRLYLRGSYSGFTWGNLDIHQVLWSKGPGDHVPMTRDYLYG